MVATVTVVAAVTQIVLGTVSDPEGELRLLLLPLLGAVLSSGGVIMLNPKPETRRIVIGRSIFALLAGVLAPQIVALVHPSLASVAVKPAVLVLLGALFAVLGYVLSKPFCKHLYARAEGIAQRGVDELEERLLPPRPEKPKDV